MLPIQDAKGKEGQLHCRSDYVDGRDGGKNGKTLCYHDNGQLSTIFANDKASGARRTWNYDRSGKLVSICDDNFGNCQTIGGSGSTSNFDWFRAMNQQINSFNRSYESGAIQQELDNMDSLWAEAERAASSHFSSTASNPSSATQSDSEYPSCKITTPCGVRTGTLVNGKCWLEMRCGGPSN